MMALSIGLSINNARAGSTSELSAVHQPRQDVRYLQLPKAAELDKLLDAATYRVKAWGVPTGSHRGNVLWFSQRVLKEAGVTDLTYDPWGSYDRIVYPADSNGNRYAVKYVYDDDEHNHVAKTTEYEIPPFVPADRAAASVTFPAAKRSRN